MTITLEEDLSDGAYLKFNVASPTGIQSVQGYDQVNDNYASAISGNSNLKFNDAWNTGSSTGIFFVVTDSGSDTIVTPNITFPANSDTTYSTSWVDSGDNAILRLTAGGSGSGNDDLTLVAGSNVAITPSGDNLTIAANNTTNYSLDNASGLPGGTQTLVMLNSGTQGIIRGLKPGSNISMSTTDSDADTGYVTINASLSGATVVVAEANPLGGWLTHTSSTIRFIDNGKITWALSGDGATTTVTPTIASYSAGDVGASPSNHNHDGTYAPASHSHSYDNYSSWTIGGDSGTSGVGSGQTATIAGSAPISTVESGRTVTVSLDSDGVTDTHLAYNTGQHLTTSSSPTFNEVTCAKIRLTNEDDAAQGSSAHAFQVGSTSGQNIIMDQNEIMGRNNSNESTLHLNADGGGSGDAVRVNNNLSSDYVVKVNNTGDVECRNVYGRADVYAYYSSDPLLKTNKELIDDPLKKLSMIGGYSYDWKPEASNEGEHLKGHDYGVMADEIEKILPELVTTRESGVKAVRYDKIIPLLIEAVKELNNKVNNGLE